MHIGLADFAEPTLLILGDVMSLNWLADCMEAQQPVELATSPFVKLVNVNLVIEPTDHEGRLSRASNLFKLEVSASEAQEFAEQLRALAASQQPAHAYLDSKVNSAGVQVIASQGEYSADTVFLP